MRERGAIAGLADSLDLSSETPQIQLRPLARRDRSADLDQAAPEADDPIVLCVAHVVPYPPRAGNHQRIHRYLRWIERRGHQVVMISSPLPGEELSESELEHAASGIRNFVYCDRKGTVRVCAEPHIARLFEDLDGRRARPSSDPAPRFISAEHRAMDEVFCPDVAVRTVLHLDSKLSQPASVISHYVFSTRFLPHMQPGTLKILDTIDVFSTKNDKVEAFGVQGQIILHPDEEREFLLRADVLMAIQSEEARELDQLTPDRQVITAGIDFDPAPEDHVALPDYREPRILMIASANAMNVKGMLDFLKYAWPLVLRDHPNAMLWVAGAISKYVPVSTPRVKLLGFVDSLDELYRDCHLVINPAVAGTGLKIKTVEALAAHRPIVTWPLGVDGLSMELKKLCAVARDWYEFYIHVSARLGRDVVEPFTREQRDRIAIALSGATNYGLLSEVLERRRSSAAKLASGDATARPKVAA